MKYTIAGFSQSKMCQYGYDLVDAHIIRFCVDFYNTGQMKTKEINGITYFWMHYDTVVKELPILSLTKRGLADRMAKLCGTFRENDINGRVKGKNKTPIFMSHVEKTNNGTYTYFCFIDSALLSLLSDSTTVQTNVRTAVQTGVRTAVQTAPKDPSTNNPSTNNNSNESSKRRNVNISPFVKNPPDIKEIQQYLDEKEIYSFTAEQFFYHYETVGWVYGKNRTPVKSWKGCVQTWVQRSGKGKPKKEPGKPTNLEYTIYEEDDNE